ncbi:chorismate synthase [Methanolinea mesophila]|uniref:chorismate synthase n=1 Tax=Methanolinea mesophila TaxID=547055 RepID=UPI001AEB8BD1|nr:chorismate synthase [Methanolinea mesophila]MBP1927860.1 chorismate synthase [Methanolinea mesophila]
MNTFGRNFRCTTFGESHGPAIGVVIDGCPPGVPLEAKDLQPMMDRRRPGTSALSSPRAESDTVEILSGVFSGLTTGTPVCMLIRNRDAQPGDYDRLKEVFRPGHADYTFLMKYGIRDHRGGGRSSGRETAARVAAGALAMKLLGMRGITVEGRVEEIHGKTIPCDWEEEIRNAAREQDSVGGIVEVIARGCPAGLGDPVFGKLDAAIAAALMGIGAVKGVEIGNGFSSARMKGSEQNDQMGAEGFLSNHAGGILGGISNGNEIVARIAVKPTPSIGKSQQTADIHGTPVSVSVQGRHDPCIVPRIVPVAEAMIALVLIDAFLEQEKYTSYCEEDKTRMQQ